MNPSLERITLFVCTMFLGFTGCKRGQGSGGAHFLTVYCAAGLRTPMEAVAENFTRETGVRLRFQFGGSGTLLSHIKAAKKGDLYIAADEDSIAHARAAKIVNEVLPFASQKPVIAVRKGNPKGVKTFADLFRTDLKVAVANPESASIGKATKAAAGAQWKQLANTVTVMKPTVMEIAADLVLGAVDAAVVWETVLCQFLELEAVTVPELDSRRDRTSAAVLSVSEHPGEALRFARFLGAPEKGGAVLRRFRMGAIAGDSWFKTPGMLFHTRNLDLPVMDELVRAFAAREDSAATTVFKGCETFEVSPDGLNEAGVSTAPDAY